MQDSNKTEETANPSGKLLTPQELAEWLQVPLSWVYDRTRKSGPEKLPFYKIGKYLRFAEQEVIDYLKIKSVDSPQQSM